MSDPRSRSEYRNSPAVGTRELLDARQIGQSGEHEAREMNIENVRRLKQPVDKAAPAPIRAATPPATAVQKPVAEPVDRLHKWCSHYVFVSNDHNAGEDKIPNPGYRPATATFSTIQGAYDYAKTYLVPLLTSSEHRVTVAVIGGYYAENLTLEYGQVDIIGIGRPKIYGHTLIAPGTSSINRIRLEDLEFNGIEGFYALTISPPIGDFPIAPLALVEIDHCWIHGKDGGIDSEARILVNRSIVEVDYKNSSYTNLDTPAIRLYKTAAGFSEIVESTVSGVIDKRGGAFPNSGMSIWAGNKAIGAYTAWDFTGVIFRHSTIIGYYRNDVWNLIFTHCDLYAGKKHATAGDLLGFISGDTGSGIHGALTLDHCGVSCRYIAEESDMTAPGANGVTDIYIQFTKQLTQVGAAAGSSIVPSPTLFGTYGFASTGNTYVVHGATWRAFFNGPGGVELAALTNSDVNVAVAALPSNYVRYTRY